MSATEGGFVKSSSTIEGDRPVGIWVGETISKIEGTRWPRSADGTVPLAYSVETPKDFHLNFSGKTFQIRGKSAYLICSAQHLITNVSIEGIFAQPLSFEQAKQKTIELFANISFLDAEIGKTIREWQPGTLPPNNDSKFLLKQRRRTTYAATELDGKIAFRLTLAEETTNQWQLRLMISLQDRSQSQEDATFTIQITEEPNVDPEFAIPNTIFKKYLGKLGGKQAISAKEASRLIAESAKLANMAFDPLPSPGKRWGIYVNGKSHSSYFKVTITPKE